MRKLICVYGGKRRLTSISFWFMLTPPPDGYTTAYQYDGVSGRSFSAGAPEENIAEIPLLDESGGAPRATEDVAGTPQGSNPPPMPHVLRRQVQNRNIHQDMDVVFVCTDMEGSTAMAAANAVRLRSLGPDPSLERV